MVALITVARRDGEPYNAADLSALTRLAEGTYGYCYECGDEIAERRLRALPFAARCKRCEEVCETERNRERVLESRSKAVALFSTVSS